MPPAGIDFEGFGFGESEKGRLSGHSVEITASRTGYRVVIYRLINNPIAEDGFQRLQNGQKTHSVESERQ